MPHETIEYHTKQNLHTILCIIYEPIYNPIYGKIFFMKTSGSNFKAINFSHKEFELGELKLFSSLFAFRESNFKCVTRSTVNYKVVNPHFSSLVSLQIIYFYSRKGDEKEKYHLLSFRPNQGKVVPLTCVNVNYLSLDLTES